MKFEKNKTFPRTIGEFIKYFFKSYRPYFIIMLLINIFVALYTTIQPYVLKELLDAAEPFLDNETLIRAALYPALFLIALTLLNNLVRRLGDFVYLKSLPALRADIVEGASDHIHGHSFKFFQENLSGAISNRIVDLANYTDTLIINGRKLFQNTLIIISAIFISAVVNPIFSIVFIAWTLLFIVFALYFSKSVQPFSREFAKSRSYVVGKIVDSFVNSIIVILFGRTGYEKSYLRSYLNDMVVKDQILHRKLMQYTFLMSGMAISIQTISMGLLLYLGSIGLLTIGDFALIFMLTLSLIDKVWDFTENLFKAAEQVGIFKQALSFMSTEHEIVDSADAVPLRLDKGMIVFSRVKFFYTESQQLFEEKTLVIHGGEKVGLVGHSGSGKSTFVNLITRVFDTESGDILIDNQSIRSITLQSLHENIAFIPQEPMLFHRTLMDNIRYGKLDATDEEVIEAAKKAHVHEFAIELPEQYQTLVGERGVKISGGQRQRIAIARAILKNSPILILDEATSSLDSITEALIQDSLKIAMKNKTVIIIAHRLSTIQEMDRILVFDKGSIVEEGTHEYLLEKGEIYKNLWGVQQGFLSEM